MPGSLKDTFKNSKIAKTAAALTVAVPTVLAAFGGAATDAMAGDGEVSFKELKPTDSQEFITSMSATASKGMVSVTVHSDMKEMLKAAYLESQDVERDTKNVDIYFLQAPGEGPVARAVIFADGLKIGEVKNGGNPETFRKDLRKIIDQAGSQLAALPTEQPTTPDRS